MITVFIPAKKKAEIIIANLDCLFSHRDYVARVQENPKRFWKELKDLADSINKVDKNRHLEAAFAERQMNIIQENWIGEKYPDEYLGREHREFWKAETDEQKTICETMLVMVKGWTSQKGRSEDGRKHTNNFHMYFPGEGARSHSCRFLSKEDFNKLDIPTNVLAKIYAYLHVQRVLDIAYCNIHNAITVERLPSLTTEECWNITEKISNRVRYKDFVWKNLHNIFDRLVLEFGYNPVILKG